MQVKPVNCAEHRKVKKNFVKIVIQVPLFWHGFEVHGRVTKFVVIKLDAVTQADLKQTFYIIRKYLNWSELYKIVKHLLHLLTHL